MWSTVETKYNRYKMYLHVSNKLKKCTFSSERQFNKHTFMKELGVGPRQEPTDDIIIFRLKK